MLQKRVETCSKTVCSAPWHLTFNFFALNVCLLQHGRMIKREEKLACHLPFRYAQILHNMTDVKLLTKQGERHINNGLERCLFGKIELSSSGPYFIKVKILLKKSGKSQDLR